MISKLDLTDIQGNLIRAYGRASFQYARYVFFRVDDARGAEAREFIKAITKYITTSVTWGMGTDEVEKPLATTNIAFTYDGLEALGLPRASLFGFPPEFAMGMKNRKDILGDDGPSAPERWDKVWQGDPVHIFISINGQSRDALEQRYAEIMRCVADSQDAVCIVAGHRGDDNDSLDYQDASVIFENGKACSKEHFGYTDAIGDPVFEGMPDAEARKDGRGKQVANGWEVLAAGEFILGHLDEAREYPAAPEPFLLSRNGSFMVYRKLHQNVGAFNKYLEQEGATYPGGKDMLAAKFVGRWRDNGAPLVDAPDHAAKQVWDAKYAAAATDEAKDRMLSNFTFDDDQDGGKCPFSAHLRRVNPRASLQTESGAFDTPGALANRRRVLRRGLPYGTVGHPHSDSGEHGIIIMMVSASISRQFEFVQQQWINYGNDFRVGNDKDIILGNHGSRHPSKAVIQVAAASDSAPYFLRNIPRFVETRGGDYFFMPSMTALRLIALGLIDPT